MGKLHGLQPGLSLSTARRAKRDIQYLDPSEVERLAAEITHSRLATYEYSSPALSGPRHLGFIIEDQPDPSFAVEPDRGHVDLYGYASMLLAAVQSQDRRIQQLEAEVERLRAQSCAVHR